MTDSSKCSESLHSLEKHEPLRRLPTEFDDHEGEIVPGITRTMSRPMTRDEEDELSRVLTGRETFKGPMPPMGPGNPPIPAIPDNQDVFRVEFTGPEDPSIAQNWPSSKKLVSCTALTFGTLMVAWGSAIYGAAMTHIRAEFHIGTTPAALGISLYVLGFACGPVAWGPLSELYGRKPPLVVALFLFMCFTFATATAKDTQTLMLGRFFSGATGASTFSIVPAILADMFTPSARGTAVALFSLAVNGGPMIAPVAGAYMVASGLNWRWTLYITGIGSGAGLLIVAFFCQETFQPVILARRAAELRTRTGNWAIHAPQDSVQLDIKKIVENSMVRPMKMLASEPILLSLSIYQGFIYALLYMCLEAIPIVFENYEFKGGNIMLPYIAVFVGSCLSILVTVLYFDKYYAKTVAKSPYPVVPEARLPLMMLGAVALTISIFWQFWTAAYPKTPEHPHGVHWISPVIALAFFGFGYVSLFLPIMNYILDCYLLLAASAVAGNTFLRSVMAAAFPLFTTQMFHNLGIQWAGTLVGGLSLILMPAPFLFRIYGPKLRSSSKFAFNLADSN